MKKLKFIAHFDVDKNLNNYLKGETYPFSINATSLAEIPVKEQLEAVSFKSLSPVDCSLIDSLPKIKLLITRTAGIDHIDIKACKKKGVAVYNIPDYGAYNIAEYAIALLLAGAKNIISSYKQTQKGDFSYSSLLSLSLKEKTLGVIGTGKIGIGFIKLAKAFGLKIITFDKYKNGKLAKEIDFEYVSLDKLLQTSDFISLHVPLLPDTKHLIGEREVIKMKPGVILVNTSRGAVIDTKALIRHVNKFKAICLDVLEDEKDFSKKHPLLAFDNVIITPHVAFYSDTSIKTIAEETLKNIKRFEEDDPTNRVA